MLRTLRIRRSAGPESIGRALENQRELQDDLLEDLGGLVAQMKAAG